MPYQRVTLAELQARLSERQDGAAYWTAEQQRLALNEALELWNLLTARWSTRETAIAATDNWDYATTAAMLRTVRLEYDGLPVTRASLHQLDLGRPRWRNEHTGSGGDVPTKPLFWAPVSLTLYVIWPAVHEEGHTLTLDGVAATPQLLLPGDYIDVGEEDLDVLLGCAYHVMTFSAPAAFTATDPAWKAFLMAAAEENAQLKASQLYKQVMGVDVKRLERPTRALPTALDDLSGRTP